MPCECMCVRGAPERRRRLRPREREGSARAAEASVQLPRSHEARLAPAQRAGWRGGVDEWELPARCRREAARRGAFLVRIADTDANMAAKAHRTLQRRSRLPQDQQLCSAATALCSFQFSRACGLMPAARYGGRCAVGTRLCGDVPENRQKAAPRRHANTPADSCHSAELRTASIGAKCGARQHILLLSLMIALHGQCCCVQYA